MFMFRKLKAAGLNSQELLIVYKGYIRPLLEYAAPPPRGTQVLLNSRLTRLRTFRSECANTSLVGTTIPTSNLLLHWGWKPFMTGVSIFAGILLARYLLLVDSQLGLLPLFRIPSCNSGEVMLSNHSGTRLSGSNLVPPIYGQPTQFMISFSLLTKCNYLQTLIMTFNLTSFFFFYICIYLFASINVQYTFFMCVNHVFFICNNIIVRFW